MIALSQRDPRWKDAKLGTSTTTTIGSHGCTITCLAMATGLTPPEVNRSLNLSNGYANTNLVIWEKVPIVIPGLKFIKRSRTYDNEAVKAAIAQAGFCLVEVDFDGKIDTPADMHWVLYIGNGKLLDPWTGVEKSTGWYPIPKGYAVFEKMPLPVAPEPLAINDQTKIDLGEHGILEVQAIRSKLTELKALQEAAQGLTNEANMWKGFVEKWMQEWMLPHDPIRSDMLVLEEEMGKHMPMHDALEKHLDALEEIVGNFDSQANRLEAAKLHKKDDDEIREQLGECQQKLSTRKILNTFRLFGYTFKVYKGGD